MSVIMDKVTHHMVPRAGVMTCAYCGKTASELGPEPEQRECPQAP